jgi:hypothetical protein
LTILNPNLVARRFFMHIHALDHKLV